MTTASDNFNRALLGSDWVQGIGTMLIVSNAATGTASVNSIYFWNTATNTFGADQESQVVVGNLATGAQYASVAVRASGTRCYEAYTDGVAGALHTAIARIDAGVETEILTVATTFTAGDVLKLGIVGTTLQMYKNGTAVGGTIVDATYASGQPGIGTYDVATVDDWSALDSGGGSAALDEDYWNQQTPKWRKSGFVFSLAAWDDQQLPTPVIGGFTPDDDQLWLPLEAQTNPLVISVWG